MQGKFRDYILASCKNDCFDYYDTLVISNILDNFEKAGGFQEHWLKVYIRILARIKDGHGIPDHANKNGKSISLPLGRKQYMSIFFTLQPNKRFLIYDFKIGVHLIK